MNDIFRSALWRYVLVFFNDILIYSKTWSAHLSHLKIVFDTLLENQLFVNRSKCLIGQQEVEYLGHTISPNRFIANPGKIINMKSWPTPTNTASLRGFLGLTGYYRQFIQNYSSIVAPLTKLLKKDGFKWSQEVEKAFQRLKQAMVQAIVLALPDFSKLFIVKADASGNGLGAILMQEGRPIAFYSKAIFERALGRSTYEKELMAIVHSFLKWHHWVKVLNLHRSSELKISFRATNYHYCLATLDC